MSGHQSADGVQHEPPNMAGTIEVPASLSAKLSAAQLDQLQTYASQHHESRKIIVETEKAMSKGMSFDDAHKAAMAKYGAT